MERNVVPVIEASFKDGVLRVVLPKTAEARSEVMRIRVKH